MWVGLSLTFLRTDRTINKLNRPKRRAVEVGADGRSEAEWKSLVHCHAIHIR